MEIEYMVLALGINYAKMAEGLGAYGIRVEKPEDLEKSIMEA